MKLCLILAVMAVSSGAQAGDAVSLAIGGQRIRVEEARGCRSASCVSVSIPRSKSVPLADPAAARAPVPALAAATGPRAEATASVATSRPPQPQPAVALALSTAVVAPPPKADPINSAAPEKASAGAPASSSSGVDVATTATSQAGDTPCGTWQAQGNKGSVRIEQCGPALCGYVFDPSTAAKGVAILINMRPRAEAEWSGQIYSLASGGIYHARMTMPSPNTLRVEACAIGRFLCAKNLWSRTSVDSDVR